MNIFLRILLMVFAAAVFSACGLTIEGVHYGWPVESVLSVGNQNLVEDGHHGLSFSVAQIAEQEFKDSTALRGQQVRLLRSDEGFYFITAKGFKNVYVMKPGAGQLSLKSTIEVSSAGLKDPALNQRPPYVELLDGNSIMRLTRDDMVEGKKQ
jgi:hypothetical protein